MLDDFFIRSIIAGFGITMLSGPLGCIVSWKKMSFFGDALSHSAILGIAMSYLFHVDQTLGILLVLVLFAILLVKLQSREFYSTDTILAILSHGSLAIGLFVTSMIGIVNVDFMSYLFGDILATSVNDIITIYACVILSLLILAKIWKPLILITINEDLAKVEGIKVEKTKLIFILLMCVFVAISIKIVGILLLTSILIIPAATARKFSRTPEQMSFIASIFAGLSVISGLLISMQMDTPSGPTIVVASLILFSLKPFSIKKPT